MLLEAVAIDDPVIFCEHKYLYYHLKAEKLPTEAMPTGKARIARAGRDMTIVAYSAMVHEALAVAEELATESYGPAKAIAKLGEDGWEMVGEGPLEMRAGNLNAIYFKRLKRF